MKHTTIAKTYTIAAITILALGIPTVATAADKGCSNATMRGTYGYTSTGSIAAPPQIAGPIAEVGTQTFDGSGGTAATATISTNGNLQQLSIVGTYTVNPDCTGTFTLQVSPFGITVHVLFVLDDNGDGFQAMETDAGLIITRVGRRLFPGRAI